MVQSVLVAFAFRMEGGGEANNGRRIHHFHREKQPSKIKKKITARDETGASRFQLKAAPGVRPDGLNLSLSLVSREEAAHYCLSRL